MVDSQDLHRIPGLHEAIDDAIICHKDLSQAG